MSELFCKSVKAPKPEESCKLIQKRINKVYWDPETGKCHDEDGNFIGMGKWDDSVINIKYQDCQGDWYNLQGERVKP